MTTKIIQLYTINDKTNTHAICNQNSTTCIDSTTVGFNLPVTIQKQCCGYVELYISPAPPLSRVILTINDLELPYQQCPVLHSDGTSVGVVKMLTTNGPLFFSPSTIVSLKIYDPTTQISLSGYSVSAKVVCYQEKNCDALYEIEHPITIYESGGPCSKNNTTGNISCPDGYCITKNFSAKTGIQNENDPSKYPKVSCPCTQKKYTNCSDRCHTNSTCIISTPTKPGMVQYGTCSGCSKIGCVNISAGI